MQARARAVDELGDEEREREEDPPRTLGVEAPKRISAAADGRSARVSGTLSFFKWTVRIFGGEIFLDESCFFTEAGFLFFVFLRLQTPFCYDLIQ